MTDKPVKLRAIMTWTYDANPENYGTDDPGKMAAIDQDQDDMVAMLCNGLDSMDFAYIVKPERTNER